MVKAVQNEQLIEHCMISVAWPTGKFPDQNPSWCRSDVMLNWQYLVSVSMLGK